MIPNKISDQLVGALCNTLMHSLWQGILLAAIAGLIVICTRKASSALRYNHLDPAKWFNLHVYARYRILHTVTNFYTGRLNTTGEQLVLRPALTFTPARDGRYRHGAAIRAGLPTSSLSMPRGVLSISTSRRSFLPAGPSIGSEKTSKTSGITTPMAPKAK
jgi:hypothetical protein